MAAEARALGHGGIRLVARAAGVREATVSLGAGEPGGRRGAAGPGTPAGRGPVNGRRRRIRSPPHQGKTFRAAPSECLHLACVAGRPALWCLDGLGVALPPFVLHVL